MVCQRLKAKYYLSLQSNFRYTADSQPSGDASCDDPHIYVHPESMTMCCKLALYRVTSAMKNTLRHRSAVVQVQCDMQSNQGCKVKVHGGVHVTKLCL